MTASVAAVALAVVVTDCTSPHNHREGRAAARPIGALAPGFFDRAAPPAPEGMIKPSPGSWDSVHPPRGYEVVLLTVGSDLATATLVTAVNRWASGEAVRLKTVVRTQPDGFVDGIVEAMHLKPDLIICAGSALVEALALVTASHLDQQFLVIGAQLPEPTVNVTAAVWRGASGRGGEAPDTSSLGPAAHADAAIRAGVASVLSDLTGIVIWLN